MNINEKMELEKANFTKSEQKIYEMIKKDLIAVLGCDSIIDYAELCGVSKSAVSRFAIKLGYTGFSQMKYDLLNYAFSRTEKDHKDPAYIEILNTYKNALDKTIEMVSEKDINEIASLIAKCRSLKVYGLEASGYTANIFCSRLIKMGIDAVAATDLYSMRYASNFAKKDDVHMFISVSCRSQYIESSIKSAFETGTNVILITSNQTTKLKKFANKAVFLPTIRGKDQDYYLADHSTYLAFLETIIEKISEQKK